MQVIDNDGDGKFRQIKNDKVLFDGEVSNQNDPKVRAEIERLGLGKRKLWAQGNLHQLWKKSSHYRVVDKMIQAGYYNELVPLKLNLKSSGANLASDEQWTAWRHEAAENRMKTLWESSEKLSQEGNLILVANNVSELAYASIFLGIKFDTERANNLMNAARKNCDCRVRR